MKQKDNLKLSCKIVKIRRVMFFENDPADLEITADNIKNTQMSMGAELVFDEKNNQIIVVFDVKCLFGVKELFGIKTAYHYHVPELINRKNEKGFNIPDPFMLALLATTVSGTRGMLEMSKTIPAYQDIILPMVDTNKMINDLKNKS